MIYLNGVVELRFLWQNVLIHRIVCRSSALVSTRNAERFMHDAKFLWVRAFYIYIRISSSKFSQLYQTQTSSVCLCIGSATIVFSFFMELILNLLKSLAERIQASSSQFMNETNIIVIQSQQFWSLVSVASQIRIRRHKSESHFRSDEQFTSQNQSYNTRHNICQIRYDSNASNCI